MSQVITIDDFQTSMGSTAIDPGIAQQVVDGVNGWIEDYTNRCFGETKQITETYDYAKTLYLRHMDVVSVDQIDVGYPGQSHQTLDATGYFSNRLGRVTMLWASRGFSGPSMAYNDWMSVTYTYGVLNVPDDLKMAALNIAGNFYNFVTNGQHDVSAFSVGSYHVEYASKRTTGGSGNSSDPATSTSDASWAVIDKYRQRKV